jgi:predicted MFS family arabinose efflux permease
VWLILILTFLARADSSMMQSNNPLLAHQLGARLSEIALVSAIYAGVTIVVRFSYSARVPLSRVPRVMTVGFVLLAASVVAILVSRNFSELLLAVGFSGVSTALIMPHLLSLMGGLSEPAEREKNLSYYSLALSSSLVIAPIIGTLILTRFPLRGVYVLLLVFSVVALAAMVRYQPALMARIAEGTSPRAPMRLRSTMRDLWQSRIYMNGYWVLLVFNLSFAGAMTYGGVDVKALFHLPYVMVELVLTSFFVASLVGRLAIARFVRRGLLTKKATWMFVALGVGAVGLALMGWAPNLGVFLIGFWLLGWPHAALFPLITMRIVATVDKSQLVAANTLAQSSFDLSSTFGPVLLGMVAQVASLAVGFWLIAVLQVVAMLVLYREVQAERKTLPVRQEAG